MNHHAAYQGQIRLTMKKQFICFYSCDLTNLWQLEQWFSKCEPQISITWELVRNANCGHHPAKIPQKWRCAFLSASYRRFMISICNITHDGVCLGDSPPRTVCTACEQNTDRLLFWTIFLRMLANILRTAVSLWIKAQVCLQQWFSIRDIFDFHSWGGGEEKNILQCAEYSSAPELPGQKC